MKPPWLWQILVFRSWGFIAFMRRQSAKTYLLLSSVSPWACAKELILESIVFSKNGGLIQFWCLLHNGLGKVVGVVYPLTWR